MVFTGQSGALGNNSGQGGSGKRKGRRSAGFITGAVCRVFHWLKEGKGRKTGRKRGGRADHRRQRRGTHKKYKHMFQLEVGKVLPRLEHLPGDILCRLHSENLT